MMPDERFWKHRYQATSHAAVVGGFVAGGWFLYRHLVQGRFDWALASTLAAMALVKVATMIYLRLRD